MAQLANRWLLGTLLAGVLAAILVVAFVSLAKPAPGEAIIARVEGIPIYEAEFDVGLLAWQRRTGLRRLQAPLVERYGEGVATLANLVVRRAARVAWEELLTPGHLIIETDFGTLEPEEAVAQGRAILAGQPAAPGALERIRREVGAAGPDAYWTLVVPNRAVDGHADVAFTKMRGFEGYEGTVVLAETALTLDIEVAEAFSDRVSEAEVRAYLEEFVEVMPAIIEAEYR